MMIDSSKEAEAGTNADAMRVALKEAKDLARSLEGTATTHVIVRAGDLQIEIQREVAVAAALPMAAAAASSATTQAPAAAAGMSAIVAPLVGVFYRAPSPGAKPLVQVGDTVERGQKVGIVEAMKVMNDVISDCRGVVAEILVEDAAPVTYEQRLMLIDTTGGAPKS